MHMRSSRDSSWFTDNRCEILQVDRWIYSYSTSSEGLGHSLVHVHAIEYLCSCAQNLVHIIDAIGIHFLRQTE